MSTNSAGADIVCALVSVIAASCPVWLVGRGACAGNAYHRGLAFGWRGAVH